jgi:4-diphosphocytidyl-2-C-methyl-D-erythritol kinase
MKLRILAPAKVNLALEITGHRRDGWHEIVSVVQAIDIHDVLEAEPAPDVRLEAPLELGPIEANLVFHAALLLRERFHVSEGVRLTLQKTVPHGVGLGGGSSDAAAALRLLRRLWARPRTFNPLHRLAAELGSDAPFFLYGPAAVIRGRGDLVQPLPPLRGGYFVLVVPPWRLSDKTRRVYAALRSTEYSSGDAAWALADLLEAEGEVDHRLLVNGLSAAARWLFPDLADFQERLETLTKAPFHLSGAGPTLFHLTASRRKAKRCARLAATMGVSVYVARPMARRHVVRIAPR